MKKRELNGRELADFIKERQATQVRALPRAPKLVIFYDNDSPVIAKYMSLKQHYGDDIGVEVEVVRLTPENYRAELQHAANEAAVTGIIVQLPLETLPLDILQLIPAEKDVDGLRGDSDTATATAIHWLLNGYSIDLPHLKLAIVGAGRLVGAPLARMWKESGYDVTVFDKGDDLGRLVNFDVIVTATGVPRLIKSSMLAPGTVVVDAGTASEDGVLAGDLDDAARERDDLILTPRVGGVGPLTVAMLFERVIDL